MKKIGLICLLMSALACSQDPTNDLPVVQEKMVEVRLSTADVRTYLTDELAVAWNEDDEISVFVADEPANYRFAVEQCEGSNATFVGQLPERLADASEFTVLYPYDGAATRSDGVLQSVTIPDRGDLMAGSFAARSNVSLGCSDSHTVFFNNLCGLIRVQVTGDVDVAQIVVSARGGEPLAGTVAARADDWTVTEVADGRSRMILTGKSVHVGGGAKFYVSALPGTYEEGFCVTFYDARGARYEQVYEGPKTLKRAKILTLKAELDPTQFSTTYYGKANCYTAAPGETLTFDVLPYKASEYFEPTSVVDEEQPRADGAKIVWKGALLELGELALSDSGAMLTVPVTGGSGNALVAITCGDRILWSYHIWVPYSGVDPYAALNYVNKKGTAYEVMPLALGAMSVSGAESSGCYYQWGRKDPLGRVSSLSSVSDKDYVIAEDGSGVPIEWITHPVVLNDFFSNLDYVMQNPHVFMTVESKSVLDWTGGNNPYLWGDPGDGSTKAYKSIYDPCPAGYMVAPKDLWTGFSKSGATTETIGEFNAALDEDTYECFAATIARDYGLSFYCTDWRDGATDFYPVSGIRSFEGGFEDVGSGGHYWSRTGLYSSRLKCYLAAELYFGCGHGGGHVRPQEGTYYAYGYPVRCVKIAR